MNIFREFEGNIPQHYPKINLYIGHTVSIQLLLMALKINEGEEPLKATDYYFADNREYRTSLQTPFLGNVIAVFHKLINT